MARPASFIRDFEFLKENGIDAIISLTEYPLQMSLIEEFGFEYMHLPISDFEAPTMTQIDEFTRFTKKLRGGNKKIVIHCDSGIGRTGTMLALYLVSKGFNAKNAISEVRTKRPGSIETSEQEDIVFRYERLTASKNKP